MENYFDIVPHARGWIYVMGGMPSASFPSYALALRAAHAHAERDKHRLRKPVFRRQELNGVMAPLDVSASIDMCINRPYPQIRP